MILYRNTKVKIRSPDGDTYFFDSSAREYINTIFIYNLSRLRNSNVVRSNKRKWLYDNKKKARTRRYSTKTITNPDYADDIALQANILTQVESRLQSLEQAAGGIGHYLNANKMEYMCCKREGAISSLNGGPRKLVHVPRQQ